MAAILVSHSLIKILLLGVLLNSAQIGIFSIKIADKSPKKRIVVFIDLGTSPRRKLLPETILIPRYCSNTNTKILAAFVVQSSKASLLTG
jgi:hypothetical protein